MGKILKKLNWTRDTYIVSSKVFWGGDSNSKDYQKNTYMMRAMLL